MMYILFSKKVLDASWGQEQEWSTSGGESLLPAVLTSLSTQVLSKGQPLGPAGVQVSLRSTGTEAKIQSTVTQPGGK